MRRVIDFGMRWYEESADMLHRADPLLMGAAIAFNALFALVPIVIALVSVSALFAEFDDVLERLAVALESNLPPDVAQFFLTIFRNSESAVAGDQMLVVVVSLIVALWSGSRAVWAVQKAFRLMQDLPEERSYIKGRMTGLLVTAGAIAATAIAYWVTIVGQAAWDAVSPDVVFAPSFWESVVGVIVIVGYVVVTLAAIYHFGPPRPLDRPWLSAGIVTLIIVPGSWLATVLLPRIEGTVIAVFGSIAIVMFWFYAVGIVVVAVPIALTGLFNVLDGRGRR